MSRKNLFLSFIALAQAGIVALVFWASARPVNQTNAPLVSASSQDISSFTVSDDTGQSLTLSKVKDVWVLADSDNFPADEFKISSFLSKVTNLTTQGLIARNANSYERLSIADTNFVRKIELTNSSGKDDVIYLGSSPRASSAHIRSSSSPNVYLTSALTSSDIGVSKSAWIDTNYLSFSADDATEVKLKNANGEFLFSKENGVWSMANAPEGETFDPETLTSLLGKVSGLRMQEPLKLATTDAFGTDQPVATLEVKTNTEVIPESSSQQTETNTSSDTSTTPAEPTFTEAVYTIDVGNSLDNAYAVKASTSDYVVNIGSFAVEDLIKFSSQDFMVKEEAPQQP